MKRVLVVDDEVEIVDLIRMVLTTDDVEILAAHDGNQALEMVREHRPDLVLSDVMMPHLNGQELCRRIKADSELAHIPVILISAMHRLDASECGADELIHKPFDITSVQEVVGRFLSGAT